jgi:hypothetical protein
MHNNCTYTHCIISIQYTSYFRYQYHAYTHNTVHTHTVHTHCSIITTFANNNNNRVNKHKNANNTRNTGTQCTHALHTHIAHTQCTHTLYTFTQTLTMYTHITIYTHTDTPCTHTKLCALCACAKIPLSPLCISQKYLLVAWPVWLYLLCWLC